MPGPHLSHRYRWPARAHLAPGLCASWWEAIREEPETLWEALLGIARLSCGSAQVVMAEARPAVALTLANTARDHGLAVELRPGAGSPGDPVRRDRLVVATHPLSAWAAAEAAEEGHLDLLGEALGHPPCCTRGFPELAQSGVAWPAVLRNRRSAHGPSPWTTLALATARSGRPAFSDRLPCSLGCPAAEELGAEGLRALRALGLHELSVALEARARWPARVGADAARPSSGAGEAFLALYLAPSGEH